MHLRTTHTSKIDRVLSDEYTGIALHRPSSTSSLSKNLQNKLDIASDLVGLTSDLPGLASDLPGLASDLTSLVSLQTSLVSLQTSLVSLTSDLPGLTDNNNVTS
jgi:hypothetical protein